MARILPIAVAEGNVAEGGPMATVGSTCQHSEKNEKGKSIRLWNSILKPKKPENSSKNVRKTQKCHNLLKTKRMLNADNMI